ncbi:MAG: hypothetical protein KBC33_02485 [Candidatus Pacebacteria bacterium]|nr:hypothetical protein [Candidatus Paceibacterota bacterium]
MKNTLYTLICTLGLLSAGVLNVHAQVVGDASSDSEQDAVAVEAIVVIADESTDQAQDGVAGIDSNESSDLAQDGAAGVTTDPSTDQEQDGTAGVISSPSTDEDQDGPVVTTPPTDTNGGNGNGGSNGGSNRGSGNGSNSGTLNPMVLGATTTSCPLITDYLKLDGDNDALQVTKLQIFLNGSESAGLIVNGTFDESTENAVKNFQKKYMTDILGPWDATRATGFVYITTLKKINALACASPITLSAEELAIIEAYKARGGSVTETGSNTDSSVVVETGGVVGKDNVAATADASILSRFWNFLKNLFR